MKNDILSQSLNNDFLDTVDRFFSIAAEHGVEKVSLDCNTRKMDVIFHFSDTGECDEGNPASYYQAMSQELNAEKRARGIYAVWKRKQFIEPSVPEYQRFIGKQLETLLQSDFLVLDDWSPVNTGISEELAFWNLKDKGYEQRYCLLRQIMKLERNRFLMDEAVVGRYILSRDEKLTKESKMAFLCFVQICELVYADMVEIEQPIVKLSEQDEALLERLLSYIPKGNWKAPATCENIQLWINTLFGADISQLDPEDEEQTRLFRNFFKSGKAGAYTDRVEVSMANLLGYLMSYQLLVGAPKQISTDFFRNDNQVNNINKGKNKEGNQDFKNLLPLLDKYRAKLIL